MNFGENKSQQSLENHMNMSEGPISSLPLYMRQMRPIRSLSINRETQGSAYIKDSFLFDKLTSSNVKDDMGIQNAQKPNLLGNLDTNQFMPRIIKPRLNDNDGISSVGGSSQSSIVSFNDGGSVSSLDLSFDGSGVPYFRNYKQSAFSLVKGSKSDHSEDDNNNNTFDAKVNQNINDVNESSHDSKKLNKSSFFRLKNEPPSGDKAGNA
jgi:hypothetical protein